MKISTLQYAKALLDLTENKSQEDVLDIVKNFAQQLKNDGQLKNAAKIMEKFGELYNKQHGIVVTEVRDRGDLSEDILKKVKEFVKKKYSAKEVEITRIKDEKMKGGIIVKVGDEIIDGSVAGQLKRLRMELVK